jgi:hypothetical protein
MWAQTSSWLTKTSQNMWARWAHLKLRVVFFPSPSLLCFKYSQDKVIPSKTEREREKKKVKCQQFRCFSSNRFYSAFIHRDVLKRGEVHRFPVTTFPHCPHGYHYGSFNTQTTTFKLIKHKDRHSCGYSKNVLHPAQRQLLKWGRRSRWWELSSLSFCVMSKGGANEASSPCLAMLCRQNGPLYL